MRIPPHEFPVDNTILRGCSDRSVHDFRPAVNLRCKIDDILGLDRVSPRFCSAAVVLQCWEETIFSTRSERARWENLTLCVRFQVIISLDHQTDECKSGLCVQLSIKMILRLRTRRLTPSTSQRQSDHLQATESFQQQEGLQVHVQQDMLCDILHNHCS